MPNQQHENTEVVVIVISGLLGV